MPPKVLAQSETVLDPHQVSDVSEAQVLQNSQAILQEVVRYLKVQVALLFGSKHRAGPDDLDNLGGSHKRVVPVPVRPPLDSASALLVPRRVD